MANGKTIAVVAIVGGAVVLFWPKIAQAFGGTTTPQSAVPSWLDSLNAKGPGNMPAQPGAPFNGNPLGAITAIGGAAATLVTTLIKSLGIGGASAIAAGTAIAGGGGAAAGTGGGSTAAATTAGGIGTAGTIAITGGIAGGALLAWGIIAKGLFRGGEEALKVSPDRDSFLGNFAQFDVAVYPGNPPGFTGLATLLFEMYYRNGAIPEATAEAQKDAIFRPLLKADKLATYVPARDAIIAELKAKLTDQAVNRTLARHEAFVRTGMAA